MTTITQRLREIAANISSHNMSAHFKILAIAAELEAHAADAVPVVAMDANEWAELYRLREAVKGPAGYETWQDAATAERRQRVLAERDHVATVSALQADITSEREHASKLRETFLRMQQDQINTEKPLDDPRLQDIFGCAIDGALTIGYQGGAAAANGHWLKPWWEKGRSVAERENALQERINALEAQMTCHDGMASIEHALEELVDRCNNDAFLSTDESVIRAEAALERCHIARRLASSRKVPASADDEYAVVWPHGGRFVAGTLKSAQDYMSGAILSCAARGVEPPVIVRYAPAETVPYEPQQDPSKERP